MSDHWPFGDLHEAHYRLILADPPWKFSAGKSRNPSNHYQTMTLRDIAALPVGRLAHPEGCRLLMWVTAPIMLLPFGPREILTAWGFRYSTMRTWAKLWPREDGMFVYPGSLAKGTGFEVSGDAEYLVIAKRGRPARVPPGKQPRAIMFGQRREHSRKPDWIRDEAIRMFAGPRAELFARHTVDGFDAWGNQTRKFNTLKEGAHGESQMVMG